MFQATHEITVTDTRHIGLGGIVNQTFYHVMLVGDEGGYGPAYTKDEWTAGAPADWELTKYGWRFNGKTSPINHSKVTVVDFEGPIFDAMKEDLRWRKVNDDRFAIRHVCGDEYRVAIENLENEGGYAEVPEIINALTAMGADSIKIGEFSHFYENESQAKAIITL